MKRSAPPLTMYGIKNCDTIKKARDWLAAQGVEYAFRDYKTDGVGKAQIEAWSKIVGWELLLNTASTTFRALPDADKVGVTKAKAIALMLAQPSMIKRPVLVYGDVVLVGFKPDVYAATFKA